MTEEVLFWRSSGSPVVPPKTVWIGRNSHLLTFPVHWAKTIFRNPDPQVEFGFNPGCSGDLRLSRQEGGNPAEYSPGLQPESTRLLLAGFNRPKQSELTLHDIYKLPTR